ncbi:hypothetical protein PFISCL1PPCAC_2903, partial [Pristionchus fissidentatus]
KKEPVKSQQCNDSYQMGYCKALRDAGLVGPMNNMNTYDQFAYCAGFAKGFKGTVSVSTGDRVTLNIADSIDSKKKKPVKSQEGEKWNDSYQQGYCKALRDAGLVGPMSNCNTMEQFVYCVGFAKGFK